MIFVKVENLKPGDIISDHIYNDKNIILIRAGLSLQPFMIKKLMEMGISGLYIKTELTKDIVIEDLIPSSLKTKAASNLQKLNISATVDNAKEAVSYILKKANLSLDYMDGRSADNYLFEHSIAVAEASVVIGKALKLEDRALEDLAVSALLHDVGKLFADKSLVRKAGFELPKDTNPYEQEMHPLYGYNLLDKCPDVKSTSKVGVLLHHINENGTGFPKFAKQPSEVYIFAKIIHIADGYDNMRHSNGGNNPALAVEYLRDNCDTLFNRDIVNKFLAFTPVFPAGTAVLLSNGLVGIVREQNGGYPLRPKIILVSGDEKGKEIDLLARETYDITIVGDGGSVDLSGQEEKTK